MILAATPALPRATARTTSCTAKPCCSPIPVAALHWIDEYEGYVHGGGDRNEYDRVVCEVRLAGGETFDAWVYLLRRVPTAERRIDSGRWVRS